MSKTACSKAATLSRVSAAMVTKTRASNRSSEWPAAATALLARDRGGPALTHQVLIYPMIDDRQVTVSSRFEGVLWDRETNHTGWSAILGDACGGPDVSPYAAPARATDLSGLPSTYLETGSSEVFRDEILDYATRLATAEVPVELHSWMGGTHAFELFAPQVEVSRACLAARASYLRRALPGLPQLTGTRAS